MGHHQFHRALALEAVNCGLRQELDPVTAVKVDVDLPELGAENPLQRK